VGSQGIRPPVPFCYPACGSCCRPGLVVGFLGGTRVGPHCVAEVRFLKFPILKRTCQPAGRPPKFRTLARVCIDTLEYTWKRMLLGTQGGGHCNSVGAALYRRLSSFERPGGVVWLRLGSSTGRPPRRQQRDRPRAAVSPSHFVPCRYCAAPYGSPGFCR
jgi:hypothetical protein